MTCPQDPHTKVYSHINSGTGDLIDRLGVAELCKGWPMYRAASEWKNFRSLFFDNVTIWMTWSGPCFVDEFIGLSKEGKANDVFIMHCEYGTLVKLSPRQNRALGKMKVTITQRFDFGDGFQFDVDCDCCYIFFCERDGDNGWKVRFVKLFYEKDKVVPVNGYTAPQFSEEELAKYPVGYRFLGAA